ncbi:MAG TPA: TIGR01777 family oxidoreductase, partial [Bacteroidales bacterium]|nr:TIGR01777 family oxidoreductase [Bacteroidales bacterium]
VGSSVKPMLVEMGFEVLAPEREFLYDSPESLLPLIENASIVIHLAGAPIATRWTRKYKDEIYHSRVSTTKNLAKAISMASAKLKLFLCASAVGIYPDSGLHDEFIEKTGTGFLARVCSDWEKASCEVPHEVRVVNLRFGLILGSNGGALPKIVFPFRFYSGAWFGSGLQWISWVHLLDAVEIMRFVIINSAITGPVNVVAPNPIRSKEFTRLLSSVLNRPAWLPVPEFVLQCLLGEGATVLTRGQASVPKKLLDAGYQFLYPDLFDALKNLLKGSGSAKQKLHCL